MRQGEFSFLNGSRTVRCDATVDKHFDGYYTLQYVHRGSVEIFYDDRRYVAKAPAVWPCYPGPHIRFHVLQKGKTWDHRFIAITGKLPCEWMAGGLFMSAPVQLKSPGDIPQTLDLIIHLGLGGHMLYQLKAVNLLENLLIDISSQVAIGREEKRLEHMMAFLGDCDNYPIDYETLAAQVNMGLSTMRRWFKNKTGMSMHTYVLQARISKARSLLLETDTPIKQVAQSLKFTDVFFFTRQFTKYVGITPAKYRDVNQG